jgi:hypothetical protein
VCFNCTSPNAEVDEIIDEWTENDVELIYPTDDEGVVDEEGIPTEQRVTRLVRRVGGHCDDCMTTFEQTEFYFLDHTEYIDVFQESKEERDGIDIP